jgi:N-acetylneuraminate synthase/N,N'-diacetyllegionaminate synthase
MSFRIGAREIGGGAPCFVIAEAGVNHNGDMALALRLIDAAAETGADAVKFQTFRAERLASPTAAKADYQTRTTDAAESQLAMLHRLELAPADYGVLKARCEERGLIFLSTPFEEESADLLERLGVVAFKLPSGEVTNLPFLRHVARKGRPIIMSTGMSEMAEVTAAVDAIATAGPAPLALLHCTSAYPADPAESNLRAMATLSAAFKVPVGFSDHTPGSAIAIAATALGAAIIEKHFTLDRTLPGPDHKASLQPSELAAMIAGIRSAELALGDGVKRLQPGETDTARVARKSVVALRDLAAGSIIENDMVGILRPGNGIPPAELDAVWGRRLARAVAAGTPLTWSDLA